MKSKIQVKRNIINRKDLPSLWCDHDHISPFTSCLFVFKFKGCFFVTVFLSFGRQNKSIQLCWMSLPGRLSRRSRWGTVLSFHLDLRSLPVPSVSSYRAALPKACQQSKKCCGSKLWQEESTWHNTKNRLVENTAISIFYASFEVCFQSASVQHGSIYTRTLSFMWNFVCWGHKKWFCNKLSLAIRFYLKYLVIPAHFMVE